MANTIDDIQKSRAERWARYREYLDGLEEHITADSVLEPGSRAFVRLTELSTRLGEVQEQDFEARQLKQEIDLALANAGAGLGGLLKAFSTKGLKINEDGFD